MNPVRNESKFQNCISNGVKIFFLLLVYSLLFGGNPRPCIQERGKPRPCTQHGNENLKRIWEELPPEKKESILANWKRFKDLPPQVKTKIIENFQRFKKMRPEIQQKLKTRYNLWKGYPLQRKIEIIEKLGQPTNSLENIFQLLLSKQKDLEISDEQIEKIKKKFLESKKKIISKKAEQEILDCELNFITFSPKLDFTKLKSLIKQKQEIECNLLILQLEATASIYNLLTPQQQKKIKSQILKRKVGNESR